MPRVSRHQAHPATEARSELERNEFAIWQCVRRLSPRRPAPYCRHSVPKLCTSKRSKAGQAMVNLGRWYTYCGYCGGFRWLSRRLNVNTLLLQDEELCTLIAIRESLRLTNANVTQLTPSSTPPSSPTMTISPSGFTPPSSPMTPTPQRSPNITLFFWTENFMFPKSIGIPRTSGGAFRLGDHKLTLGLLDVEQGDTYELLDIRTHDWNTVGWEQPIFPGSERELYLRRQGVTCQPSLSDVLIAHMF
ncbi:hypothetical protein D9756_011588 [Leucocoprinus leucothites]|uniref:Uncharacterized protein n=1 Tax=Leucocoprinus leucothites TaxID=201217 RepID=A0A8H5CM31_9AGAR|nr:hypothetical protein D9756_011588 [Leucoagaricus leucothites]